MAKVNISDKFIGKGMIFPLVVVRGSIPLSTGEDLVKSSVLIIINWSLRTRFFLGEFGSYITRLLEKQNTNLIKNAISTYVIDPLTQWEPRVENINCKVLDSEDNIINLQISYRIISTQQEISFVVPFMKDIIY